MNHTPYPAVTLNDAQQCYVVRYGRYLNTIGYDHCFETTTQLIQRMNNHQPGKQTIALPADELRGTLAGYDLYKQMLVQFAKHAVAEKTWFPPNTPAAVQSIIKQAIKRQSNSEGGIFRFFFGDPVSGLDRCQENATVGFVGQSAGPMRVPLLLEPLRERGQIRPARFGDALRTQNILRIVRVDDGVELYRCKNYHQPKLTVIAADIKGYAAAVQLHGVVQARFKKEEQAASYVALLQGHRLHEPFRTHAQAEKEKTAA